MKVMRMNRTTMKTIRIKTDAALVSIPNPIGVTYRGDNVLSVGSFRWYAPNAPDIESEIYHFQDSFAGHEAYEKVCKALGDKVEFVDISELCIRPYDIDVMQMWLTPSC